MSKSQFRIWFKLLFIAMLCFVAIYLMNGWLQKTNKSLAFSSDGDNVGFKVIGVSQQGVDKLFATSGEPTDLEIVGAGDLFGIGGGEFEPLWYKFAVFIELPRKVTDINVSRTVEIVPMEESQGVRFSNGFATEVCGTKTHRRFKVMAMVECKYTLSMRTRIALKIFYFKGKQSKGLLKFNGPFLAEEAVSDERVKGPQLFLLDGEEPNNHGNLGIELMVDNNEAYHDEPVIAYDISGQRHYLGNLSIYQSDSAQVSSIFNSTNLNFPAAALQSVTLGEVPKSVVFRNIQIVIPEKKVQPKTYPTNKCPGILNIFTLMYRDVGERPAKVASADVQASFQKMFKHCEPLTAKSAIRNGLLHDTSGAIEAMLNYLEVFPGDFEFSEIQFYQRKIAPKYVAEIVSLVSEGAKLNDYGKVTSHKTPRFAKALAVRLADSRDPHIDSLKALAKMSEPWIWWNAIDAMAKAKISIDEFPAKKSLYYGKNMTPTAMTLLGATLTIECFRFEPKLYFKLMALGLANKNNKVVLKSLRHSLRAVTRPVLHRELIAGIVTSLNRKYHKVFGLMGPSVAELKRKSPEEKWYDRTTLNRAQVEAIKWLNTVTN